MPTIGLSMIVRDEAHVIGRCLDAVRPLIDLVVIVDTGSTDGTPEAARAHMARLGLPGEVVPEPWQDFASNRTSALAALRRHDVDYALVVDADDVMTYAPGFDAAAFKAGLTDDVVDLRIRHATASYRRPQLFSNRLPFAYRSVLHEYLVVPPEARGRSLAEGLHVAYGGDGARSRDPAKFARDADTLRTALDGEGDPFLRARYTFYLAQSLRDAGRRAEAIDAYLERSRMGHWAEEVYESLLNAGRLMAAEGRPTDEVLATLDRATEAVPGRAEADHAAARTCRERGEHARGVEVAARSVDKPLPADGLFLEPWVYEVGILDEFSVSAYWAGRTMDSLVACSVLLSRPGLDAATRERVTRNRDFAHGRLVATSSLWLTALRGRDPVVAVITPYRSEPDEVLRRCAASVARQTVRTDHVVVADGEGRPWLDGAVTRHVALGRPSDDCGDTPRAVGGALVAAGRYVAASFLDADCSYRDDHVERCLRAALRTGLDATGAVAASRTLRRTDLSAMPLSEGEPDGFVDTNCLMLLPRAFGLLGAWATWPRRLSVVDDRVMSLLLAAKGFRTTRALGRTVDYVTTWAAHYRALGEEPPLPVKENPDHAGIRAWIAALSDADVAALRDRIGADVRDLYGPARYA